jgi:uncharacterized protein
VSERAVVDTGPLVAIVRAREEAHGRCVAVLKDLRAPLLTCWPVFTEASWLLRNEPGGIEALGELVGSGAVRLVELADAALMLIAEREEIGTVFTLDRRDFSVCRTTDGRALTIVPEA